MNYSDYVRKSVLDIGVGEVAEIDLMGKMVSTFRMTLNIVKGDRRFVTNVDINGKFWVKREM
jgi:hypothetical protein